MPQCRGQRYAVAPGNPARPRLSFRPALPPSRIPECTRAGPGNHQHGTPVRPDGALALRPRPAAAGSGPGGPPSTPAAGDQPGALAAQPGSRGGRDALTAALVGLGASRGDPAQGRAAPRDPAVFEP